MTRSAPSSSPARCRCVCRSPRQGRGGICWDSILCVCADDATPSPGYDHPRRGCQGWAPAVQVTQPVFRTDEIPGDRRQCGLGGQMWARPPDVQWVLQPWENVSERNLVWCKCTRSQISALSPPFVTPRTTSPSLISQIFTLFPHRLQRTRRRQFIYLYNFGFM